MLRTNSTSEVLALQSEFTPQQLENFHQAFNVFDVDKDGRVTIVEIFEVLTEMESSLSPERQDSIRQAFATVDEDDSGDLDFYEFIRFLAIMDNHNRANDVKPRFMYAEYGSCVTITVEPNKADTKSHVAVVEMIFLAYNFIHSVLVILASIASVNILGQNSDDDDRQYVDEIRSLRLFNALNLVHIMLILSPVVRNYARDELHRNKYVETNANIFRLVAKHLFVTNAVASILYLLGNEAAVSSTLDESIPALLQVAVTYLSMSYFWYFDVWIRPAGFVDKCKVVLFDLFVFNPFRFGLSVIKSVLSVAALPFMLTVLLLTSCPCLYPSCDSRRRSSLAAHSLRILFALYG